MLFPIPVHVLHITLFPANAVSPISAHNSYKYYCCDIISVQPSVSSTAECSGILICILLGWPVSQLPSFICFYNWLSECAVLVCSSLWSQKTLGGQNTMKQKVVHHSRPDGYLISPVSPF